jgi:hypothetical protein
MVSVVPLRVISTAAAGEASAMGDGCPELGFGRGASPFDPRFASPRDNAEVVFEIGVAGATPGPGP